MMEPTDQTRSQNVRVAASKRLRFEVFKRDGFSCQYCGATPPGALLECDHVEPVSKGGLTEIDNLVTACYACNRGKSNVLLSDIPQSLKDRAAETIEREAQIAGYQAILKDKRLRLEADAEEVLDLFCRLFVRDGIPQDHFTSIKMFVDKLGLDACLWAAERAQQTHRFDYGRSFRYFCGICWNRIKEGSPGV